MSTAKNDPRDQIGSTFLRAVIGGNPTTEVEDKKAKPAAPAKKPEEKPKEKPATTGAGAGDDGNPATEAEKTEAAAAPQIPAIDVEGIARAAAEGAARGMREIGDEVKATKPEKKSLEYPEQYKDDADLYDTLARTNPKYKNIKERLIDSNRREEEYITEWRKNNPGQRYDPSADEHQPFFESITVSVDPRSLRAAEAEMIAARAKREALSEIEGREREERLKRTAAELPNHATAVTTKIISGIIGKHLPDFDIAAEDSASKLGQEDPLLLEALHDVVPKTRSLVNAVLEIDAGTTEYSPRVNPTHAEIANMVQELDREILSRPIAEQVRSDGGVRRTYVSPDKLARMSAAQAQRFWTIQAVDLIERIAAASASDIQARKDRLSRITGGSKTTHNGNPSGNSKKQETPATTRSTFSSSSSGPGRPVNESRKLPAIDTGKYGPFLRGVIGG